MKKTRGAFGKRRRASAVLLAALLVLYAVASVYPLVWMAFNSLKDNAEIFVGNPFGPPRTPRWENYKNAVEAFNIPAYFRNSVLVSAGTVAATLLLAAGYSYATARMKWRLAGAARAYLALGMFIPVQIILVPLVILVRDLRLANTLFTLIVPYAAFQLSFASIVFYGFFRTIPTEYEEAAAIDGAGPYSVFFRVMLPLIQPAMATVAIFVFLQSWNEFLLALILISREALKTLPLGLVSFTGQFQTDWGGMSAAMTIASVPTILVYLVLSERVENALTVRGLK